MSKSNKSDSLPEVFVVSSNGNAPADKDNVPADFETAISSAGFGKFNIFLLVVAISCGVAPVFETTSTSYVLPVAECDLGLSLDDKGLLNAVLFAGMICSGFMWGFLCDTLGRKRLLVAGYLLGAFFAVSNALSQTKTFLMVSKFCAGFIINGPFAAFTSYISEFHSAKHRARIQMIRGIIVSVGNLALPLLAWLILPQNRDFTLGNLEFHSWNIYFFICGMPALISGIIFIFMPESPKFLMTVGRNTEAMQVFQTVYCINSGQPKNMYPVKELIDETKLHENEVHLHGGHITASRTKWQALKEGWQQITPLFFPPIIPKLALVCLHQILLMMSQNTVRLWMPQLFQAIDDYQHEHNGSSGSVCEMLNVLHPKNSSSKCDVNLDNSAVYINSMIVAGTAMFAYGLAGYLINILGKKRLINILATLSGIFVMSVYFAQSTAAVLSLIALAVPLGGICSNVMVTITVDLFPTSLRTMTVSILMMLGRSGTMIGNLIFPSLLRAGCAPTFFSVGSVLISVAGLAFLLPNTDMKALE